MGDSNTLVSWYQNRIGTPFNDDEAYGYWVFVVGVVAGFVGIALVMASGTASTTREAGIAIAAIGLVLLLVGPIIRLPLGRAATNLSYLGAVICLLGVAWFLVAFPEQWGTRAGGEGLETEVIGLYGLGVLIVAIGGVLVPLFTSAREELDAAEQRAAEAEAEVETAEQRATEAEAERDAARDESDERAGEAAAERTQWEALQAELDRIGDSQSQFELYTDRGGGHRWRLRHRNRNVVATSGEAYASRQKAQQGLSAVRRDAFGAAVIDLDRTAVDVEEAADAVEGEDAPEFVADVRSRATFETYEDAAGEHRWRLRHDNGNVIADSGEGYASASGRDDAIERVRHYAQSADYLRIEPAAFELYRDAEGKHRWRLLHRNGNILADGGQGYASRQKARQGIDSVRKNVAEGGNASFEVYEDAAGEHRWRLVHDNGNIIADSGEGYASESGADDAIDRVREYAPEAHVLDIGTAAFELYEDAGGEWRWRLRHRNGNVIADSSEGYSERSDAEDGLNSVKHNAPNADVETVDE